MGIDHTVAIWLIGAGMTAAFLVGYLALGALTDLPGVAERFGGPAIGCHYILAGLVLGVLVLPTALAVAFGLAGVDHPVSNAVLTTVFAGITLLVSLRVFDELPDRYIWFAVALVATAVGFEALVAALVVNGIAGALGALFS
jgi:hypothetical protein